MWCSSDVTSQIFQTSIIYLFFVFLLYFVALSFAYHCAPLSPKQSKQKKFQPPKNDKNNWKYLKLSPSQLWFSPCEAVLKQPILQEKKKKSKRKDPTRSPVELPPSFYATGVTDASLLSKYFPQSYFFFTAASFQLTQSLQLCCTAADRKLHFLQWQRGVKSIWG